MRFAIVGCGFVADYYMTTLVNHPGMILVGVFDRDETRSARFAAFHGTRAYSSLAALLCDGSIEMVLNLTNPSSHFEISRAALEAGKHVWTEKPLATRLDEAEALVALAKGRNLSFAAAPSTVLGEAATATRQAIAEGRIGRVRLAYAEMEDSMVFREDHSSWRSASGLPWPARDEFATGATLEHAGYYLTWLCAFFGPVEEATAFSRRLFDDKGTGQSAGDLANDFSVTCLAFRSGVAARLTCGLAAPVDRSLHIVGDEGILSVADGWNTRSPVYLRDRHGRPPGLLGRIAGRLERALPVRQFAGRRLDLGPSRPVTPPPASRIDFMRGPARQADAVRQGREPEFGADFSLHVTELSLVAQDASAFAMPYRPRSTFTLPSAAREAASTTRSVSTL